MKISLTNENKRKSVYDILNIFYSDDEITFTKDEGIIITDLEIIFNDQIYFYSSNTDLKATLYNILAEETGYKSPWGMLTGSKPSKLLQIYEKDQLKQKFYVSDEKLNLLEEIKKEQNKLNFNKDDFNLYINIPFCPTRCNYCSYPTLTGIHHDRSKYIDYLLKEINEIDLPNRLDTIYIGGGTPSYLSTYDIERLLRTINDRFLLNEFTFEAGREDTLDKQKLQILKDYNVDRISLNPQTFNKEIIDSVGRIGDLEHFYKVYDMAYNMGFIINMDFIIGLIGEDMDSFIKNFDMIQRLNPHNITFHALALKVGSKYFEEGKRASLKDSIYISKKISEFTLSNNYKPYYLYRQKNILSNLENIGYQKDESAQRYNIIINEELENVIGVGMNANSKLVNGKKYRNGRNLRDYMVNMDREIITKNKLIYEYNH